MTPQQQAVNVVIHREWRRGRLMWDANDVISALRAIGATDAAEQFAGMYERISKRDGRS